jgi:hypothetical protein
MYLGNKQLYANDEFTKMIIWMIVCKENIFNGTRMLVGNLHHAFLAHFWNRVDFSE